MSLLALYVEPLTLDLAAHLAAADPALQSAIQNCRTSLFGRLPLSVFPSLPVFTHSDVSPLRAHFQAQARLEVIMIVRDEAAVLPQALASIQDLADRVVVMDTGSHDRTVEIARAAGAEVYQASWADDFAAARNQSLDLAQGDWVLVLDADETVAPEAIPLLMAFKAWHLPMRTAFSLTQQHVLSAQRSATAQVLRLFRVNNHLRFTGIIHEQLVCHEPPYYVQVLPLPITLQHTGYLPAALARKRGRLSLLQRSLDQPETTSAYLRFQGVHALLFQQSSPDWDAALPLLRELTERALGWQQQGPQFPEDLTPPLDLCGNYLLAALGQQGQWQEILTWAARLPQGRAYAPFCCMVAQAALELKQWQLAQTWFLAALAPEAISLTQPDAARDLIPLRGLLSCYQAQKQFDWGLALTFLLERLERPGAQPALRAFREDYWQAHHLNEATWLESLDAAIQTALKARQGYEVLKFAWMYLCHHFDPVIWKDAWYGAYLAGEKGLQALLAETGQLLWPTEPLWQTPHNRTDPVPPLWHLLIGPAVQPTRLSVCMIVRNEVTQLADCLRSVLPIADEILIADTGSSDGTQELARQFPVTLWEIPWQDHFAQARNQVVERARGDWILSIDADERLDAASLQVLQQLKHYHFLPLQSYAISCLSVYERPQADVLDAIPRLFPNHPHIRFFGAMHNLLLRTDRPALLPTVHLPQIHIRHGGYRTVQLRQQRAERLPWLARTRKIGAEPNPYFLYHSAYSELYQQSEGNILQARTWLAAAIALTLRYRDQPPVIGWAPAPLQDAILAWVDACERLGEYTAVLAQAEHYRLYCHRREFFWRVARLCCQQGQLELAEQWLSQAQAASQWGDTFPHYPLWVLALEIAARTQQTAEVIAWCQHLWEHDSQPEWQMYLARYLRANR